MESNGQPGRIHVSPSTAEHMIQQGKARWLIPREDTIVAKGKGTMRTYWINCETSLSTPTEMVAEQPASAAAAAALEDDHQEEVPFSEVIDSRGTTLVSV